MLTTSSKQMYHLYGAPQFEDEAFDDLHAINYRQNDCDCQDCSTRERNNCAGPVRPSTVAQTTPPQSPKITQSVEEDDDEGNDIVRHRGHRLYQKRSRRKDLSALQSPPSTSPQAESSNAAVLSIHNSSRNHGDSHLHDTGVWVDIDELCPKRLGRWPGREESPIPGPSTARSDTARFFTPECEGEQPQGVMYDASPKPGPSRSRNDDRRPCSPRILIWKHCPRTTEADSDPPTRASESLSPVFPVTEAPRGARLDGDCTIYRRSETSSPSSPSTHTEFNRAQSKIKMKIDRAAVAAVNVAKAQICKQTGCRSISLYIQQRTCFIHANTPEQAAEAYRRVQRVVSKCLHAR